jgi:hypothetical protein
MASAYRVDFVILILADRNWLVHCDNSAGIEGRFIAGMMEVLLFPLFRLN